MFIPLHSLRACSIAKEQLALRAGCTQQLSLLRQTGDMSQLIPFCSLSAFLHFTQKATHLFSSLVYIARTSNATDADPLTSQTGTFLKKKRLSSPAWRKGWRVVFFFFFFFKRSGKQPQLGLVTAVKKT